MRVDIIHLAAAVTPNADLCRILFHAPGKQARSFAHARVGKIAISVVASADHRCISFTLGSASATHPTVGLFDARQTCTKMQEPPLRLALVG